ncbi:hypothetical protein GCM10027594_04430 [Hymenobacter agri]
MQEKQLICFSYSVIGKGECLLIGRTDTFRPKTLSELFIDIGLIVNLFDLNAVISL